jgi:hypothetical protein
MGGKIVRTIGSARARFKIGMMNPRLQYPSAGSARADGACATRQNRSPIGDPPWHERRNTRSAKAEIAESGYCSRSPIVNK